jgi:serine/threonine-protein kinase RsbT
MSTAPNEADTKGDVLEQVLGVLSQHVSKMTAKSIVSLARTRVGMRGTELTRAQLRDLLEALDRGMSLFTSGALQSAECRRALRAIAEGDREAPQTAHVVAIRGEDDIAKARTEARLLAGTMGFTMSGQTRLVTSVSELARNIVQYAHEGTIELKPATTPRGIEIVAEDRGPGIPNLDVILSGGYRSRLGMGLGLLGVKRLADPFAIETAPGRGTTVRAFLRVA